MSIWSGFYTKTVQERQQQLQLIYPNLYKQKREQLDEQSANNMIENCIGIASLSLGLGLNFLIDGMPFVVPMVIEEPSVVAAVSGAAKLISQCGGFNCVVPEKNIIYSQIQLLDIPDDDIDRMIEKVNVCLTEVEFKPRYAHTISKSIL
jgi:degradative hydroxymethylglutaryl-CoA reductase